MIAPATDRDYARALASAFSADLARNPLLEEKIGDMTKENFVSLVGRDLARELTGRESVVLFPNVRALMRARLRAQSHAPAGMGQWAEILSSVVPAIAKAAGDVYSAKVQAKTQYKIEKKNIQSQAILARQEELRAARERALQAGGQPVPLPSGTVPVETSVAAGMPSLPSWVPWAGVGAAVLVLGAAWALSGR